MTIVDVDPYLATQWERWLRRRSSSARDHLIVSYAPLVKFVAAGRGRIADERRSGRSRELGVLGLIDAIERFDPHAVSSSRRSPRRASGVRSTTDFASSTRQASLRALEGAEVERAIADYEGRWGRAPNDDELADQLQIDRPRLDQWFDDRIDHRRAVGTGARCGSRAARAQWRSADRSSAVVEEQEVRDLVRAEIGKLPDREKLILSLYYDEGLTLAQISRVLGVSESRVPQLHTKSVLHLRARLTAAGVA